MKTGDRRREAGASKFTDLIAWKESHELVIAVYEITRKFPHDETFGLTNQIRRAAVSITSNIAEGFGRRTSADRTHFYDMARGSLNEVRNQLLIACDVEYLSEEDFIKLDNLADKCGKTIFGLIKSTRNLTTDSSLLSTVNKKEA